MDAHRLSRPEFTRIVGGLCRLHRVAFAPELLLQQFPPGADGRSYRLAPGMQVSAEVHLGERSILDYLLSPISRAWHEAARER